MANAGLGKSIAIILAMVLIVVGFSIWGIGTITSQSPSSNPSSFYSTTISQNSTLPQINWSSLRGADYLWYPLGSMGGNSSAPNVSFPMMKALGWNFIRVPLSWSTYLDNPSADSSYLNQVATEADRNGIYVIYDAHAGGQINTQNFFPVALLQQYNGSNQYDRFYYAWWSNSVVYNGQGGWQYMFDSFWIPVIQATSSHKSTLGYELMNEPHLGPNTTLVQMQMFNTYMASSIRPITNKWIFFMQPYCSAPGVCSRDNESKITGVAPLNVSGIAIDQHEYNYSDIPYEFSTVSNASHLLGNIPVIIGEWAVCQPRKGDCNISQAEAIYMIGTYEAAFKKYGFPNSYWSWRCFEGNQSNPNILQSLLNQSCATYWLDSEISKLQYT